MKKLIILMVATLLMLSLPHKTYANESTQAISYSVQAVLPDNQVSDASYFDIEVEPNQEQVLEVTISNSSDEEIKVMVSANPAVTNTNGLIIYDGTIPYETESDMPKFDELVQVVEELVTVPANGEANALLSVKAAESAFEGRILGGIYFQLVPSDSEDSNTGMVMNTFSYALALNMTSSESTDKPEGEIQLNNIDRVVDARGSRLMVNFSNLSPVFLSDMSIKGQLFEAENEQTPILEFNEEMFDIAPTYDFSLPIELGDLEIGAGDYVLRLTMNNEGNQLQFDHRFTMSE